MITGNQHDDSFDDGNAGTADCVSCHTSTPSTGHWNGSSDATIDAGGNTEIQFAATMNFSDAVTPSCAPSSGSPDLSACHSDSGGWGRLWSATADDGEPAVCANCHGTFAQGWTSGAGVLARPDMSGVGGPGALTAGHATDWDASGGGENLTPNHSACKSCHGMNSSSDAHGNYSVGGMWGGASDHGNAEIDINGPSADINSGNNFATPLGAEFNGSGEDNNNGTGPGDGGLETSDWSCTLA
jgi:hypothetical protein